MLRNRSEFRVLPSSPPVLGGDKGVVIKQSNHPSPSLSKEGCRNQRGGGSVSGKNRTVVLLASCLLFTVLTGCKKEEVAPPPVASAKEVVAPVQAVMTAVKKEEYVYEAAGKRDPFKPFVELEKKEVSTRVAATAPMTPLQAFDLSELRLVGVIILPGKKVAMIEDPTGKGYNVKEGTLIGTSDGKVIEILKGEVVVEERYRDEMAKIRTRKASIRMTREEGEEGR